MIVSRYETKLTREIREGKKSPERSMWNQKPFRTKAQKHVARLKAEKRADGAYRSTSPASYHPAPRGHQSA